MSFDLFFARPEGAPELAFEQFNEHFAARPSYTMKDEQAWYSNEDTGVYFSFEFGTGEGEESFPAIAWFDINLNRPGFFALEAAEEIDAFASRFDLIVDDPQVEAGSRGRFSRQQFIESWSSSNRWGSRAVSESAGQPLTLPGERLRRIWEWNFGRKGLQERLEEDIFIPKISFAVADGEVKTFVVWPDAIPEYLPEVDSVVLIRDNLGERRWLRKPKQVLLLAPWSEVAAQVRGFPRADEPLPHFQLPYGKQPPAELVAFFRRPWPVAQWEQFKTVLPDSVLDAEIFEVD